MARRLNDDEIRDHLNAARGWAVLGKCLVRVFPFPAYLDGIDFARKCGELAEDMNHHPDLLIRWRKVRVSITTHSAGGLTELDFEYARRVSETSDQEVGV